MCVKIGCAGDAPVLHAWWNDGAVMAHADFRAALEY